MSAPSDKDRNEDTIAAGSTSGLPVDPADHGANVVGTRQGYRDVRKELNLLPGAAPPTLVVRCEEPI